MLCKAAPGEHSHHPDGNLVSPHLEVWAMGWSQALRFCPSMVSQSVQCAGIDSSRFFLNRCPAPELSGQPPAAAVYVGGAAVVGAVAESVEDLGDKVHQQLCRDGFF